MDYLARESAPFSQEIWEQVDKAVIETVKKHLVCRRFLNLFGPLGAGTFSVPVDGPGKEETLDGGIGRMSGRRLVELPQFYEDFTLLWRDLEESGKNGYPLDLSSAVTAAQRCAKREDDLILFGSEALGVQGLLNADGAFHIERGNWKEGENGFSNVARAVGHLVDQGFLGRYALVLSPDLYLDLQRLQPSVGMLELDRVSKLVNHHVYMAGSYGSGKAVLVCAEPQYMDLALGIDWSVGYLEMKDFNHSFRVMETAALRIRNPKAIVVFE